MRSLACVSVLFLMLTVAALAADQHSHPVRRLQQPQKTSGDQQQFSPDNRGTEQTPLVVKTIPPEKSKDDIQREKEKTELDRKTVQLTGNLVSYTWLLFIATAILSSATGGLALVAFLQMRDARKAIAAAEASAKASEQHATTAERALTEVERPYIFAFDVSIIHDLEIGGRGIGYSVGNFGKTPATIENVSAIFTIGNSGVPVIRPEQVSSSHPLLTEYIIRSDGVITNIPQQIPPDIELELDRQYYLFRPIKGEHLFLWITIDYNGPFTKGHVTSACWIFDEYPVGFRRFVDERYT
jgi:hypothetical protein